MASVYYQLMTSEWLQANAKFGVSINSAETNQNVLTLHTDAQDYERLFKVKLLDAGVLDSTRKYTVAIRIAMVYTGPPLPPVIPVVPPRPDPLSLTISDGKNAWGFQFVDLVAYSQTGPYRPIEGAAKRLLGNGRPTITNAPGVSPAIWPRVFNITFETGESIGTCTSALNGGHMVMHQYSKDLNYDANGLFLEAYRGFVVETYKINFIEVTVSPHD